jgi:hypothetical protein
VVMEGGGVSESYTMVACSLRWFITNSVVSARLAYVKEKFNSVVLLQTCVGVDTCM